MFAAKVLQQAARHADRTPSIKFLGKRTIPSAVDHTPHPHPESPTMSLPESFGQSSHASFSAYRLSAQQHGPLRKTIKAGNLGIGQVAAKDLGSVQPPEGVYFSVNELPARFRRAPISTAEIEAVETGGAAAFG